MEITDNTEEKQFELSLKDGKALVEYIINSKGMIFLTHTEVPPKYEGQGIGAELVEQVLKEVEKRELKLVPLCPFVAAHIRRHPKWKRLLSDNYNV